jgi:uncharacterized repeat protein (TIGR01451 family)
MENEWECPKPVVEVHKTVRDLKTGEWEDAILANVSDVVRFRICVHNSGGCCNLTGIVVNDTLSDGLEYVGNAVPAPDGIVNNTDGTTTLYWGFAGPVGCCQNITTIEFDARKIDKSDDTNCVNVSAWCNETEPHVQVVDEDCAGVHGIIDNIGVHRNGYIFFDNGDLSWDPVGDKSGQFGANGDIAIAGDWNGDGVDQVGVFRPSSAFFYIDNGDFSFGTGDKSGQFGANGDIPIVGNWDGIGGDDKVGVFRPSSGYFYIDNGNLSWDAGDKSGQFGANGDIPIVGDWDGDGVDQIGVFRPSIGNFFLDNGDLSWGTGDVYGKFGTNGDIPIVGNWAWPW